MTPSQLAVMLDLLPGPARVYDASGAVIAQNEMARGRASNQHDWEIGVRRELGGGCYIQTWNPERRGSTLARDKRGSGNAKAAASPDVGTLANSMAHSIRNPLSSIVTAAGLVRDDKGISEETDMLLGIIKKESNHLNRILTDFLNYVRPKAFQPEMFDLAEAVTHTVGALQHDGLLHPEVEVTYEFPPLLRAWGDEVQIRQALWNIMRNAAEAMPEGGALHIRGTSDGRSCLEITDSGPGFSAEDLQRAFEPFYANTSEGAGLGLSIACKAIDKCGGQMWVENAGGEDTDRPRGARVCLELHNAPPELSNNGTSS